jgi:scyllo-inositol 2-dehydrogenase (NADP+)
LKRVGIVGYGLAGRYFHAPLLQAAGFFVAAIASRSLEKRGHAHEDFPLAAILATAQDLVAEDLDLVVVASTNDLHSEHAKLAINAGIPVVVDKPMGRDYFETVELFDYAESYGIPITVFFNRLFDSDTQTIKKILAEQELGEVFKFESRFERFRPELNPNSWRENSDIQVGGGLLLDLQTHLISIALSLFGPAKLSYASLRKIKGGAEDDVSLALTHDSGIDSYLTASSISGEIGPRIRLSGSKGTLIAKDLDPQENLLRSAVKPRKTGWPEPSLATSEFSISKGDSTREFLGEPGNYVEFYNKILDSLEAGSEMPITREFALQVAEIIDQARQLDLRRY